MTGDYVQMKIAHSHGGEFEDTALIAGYCLGSLDTYLTYIDDDFNFVVPVSCIEQADLFAMFHHFSSEVVHKDPATGWAAMRFVFSGNPLEDES